MVGMSSRARFGSVQRTVLEIVSLARGPIRAAAVQLEAERLLGGPVARSSVKNALARLSKGKGSPVRRVGDGSYVIRTERCE